MGTCWKVMAVRRIILVEVTGTLTLSTNRCVHNAAREPVAEAQAGAIIASDNYLEGSRGVPAMRLQLPENGPFTVLGNITSGEIVINSGALPAPWGVTQCCGIMIIREQN